MLQTVQPSCTAATCGTYTVGVKIRFGVVLDAVMRLEFLQEDDIGIQRCVRYDRDVLQSHWVWGGLNMGSVSLSRRLGCSNHFEVVDGIYQLCIDISCGL